MAAAPLCLPVRDVQAEGAGPGRARAQNVHVCSAAGLGQASSAETLESCCQCSRVWLWDPRGPEGTAMTVPPPPPSLVYTCAQQRCEPHTQATWRARYGVAASRSCFRFLRFLPCWRLQPLLAIGMARACQTAQTCEAHLGMSSAPQVPSHRWQHAATTFHLDSGTDLITSCVCCAVRPVSGCTCMYACTSLA